MRRYCYLKKCADDGIATKVLLVQRFQKVLLLPCDTPVCAKGLHGMYEACSTGLRGFCNLNANMLLSLMQGQCEQCPHDSEYLRRHLYIVVATLFARPYMDCNYNPWGLAFGCL